ncbi:hypothetical protein [Massilia sp. TS11]|uniref:hypothetical protein n=1 Tax=Massilia sp. TS11 TaxID=2908003 RepID=UPI001EDB57D0|nr:hypothetical protein [Massilia sp. TS11]MCG2586548.1 hypothetical protein [Massilia sp. TS11]
MFNLVKKHIGLKEAEHTIESDSSAAQSSQQALTVDEMLNEMAKFGAPSISCLDDGLWHASIAMRTMALGSEFKVRSEFKHKTAAEALGVCRERMYQAIKTISSKESK